jgi:mono/diheme cytochrome c family protein
MLKPLFFASVAAALVLTMGYADQPKGKLVIPAPKTDPTNGKLMFTSYCAPCHGADGRGNGPVASALKAQPTDLTGLAKANHGKYPDNHIVAVLRFGTDVNAHGSAQMPVWGTIFAKMSKVSSQERDLRTANLSRYLESIQAR